MNISLAQEEDALAVAKIHKAEISGGFLSSLSLAFLKRFYLALVQSPASFCVVAKENGQVIGFVAGTTNLNAFYKYFLTHYFFQSFFILMPKVFSYFKKIVETLLYLKKEESLPKAELLTIAIARQFQGQGLGTLMLAPFIGEMEKRDVKVFKVAVGEELKNAIAFYEKNNFKFVKHISIHGKALSRAYVYEVK